MPRGNSFSMLAALALAVLAWTVPPSFSAPLVWNLRDVHFEDGGSATGSFTYDASTGNILNWNIVATGLGADVFPTPIDITFANVPGCNDPDCDISQHFAVGTPLTDIFVFSHGSTPATSAFLSLITAAPLTNAPGTVALIPGTPPELSSISCCENELQTNFLSGSLASVPEAASMWYLLAGIAALAGIQRARRS